MSDHFSSPPNRAVFNAQVWQIVRMIPAGQAATYGQIAALIPAPDGFDPRSYKSFSPRWVGGAMACCPAGVPWQRVINSQGKISLSGGSQSHQKELLEEEGVEFDERGKIDLKRFGWAGPPES